MRVSVLQENLAQALSIVSRAVDSRPTLPVLANVLLETDGDTRLRLSATNLELSITTYIGAKVENAGAITLPAKTFAELVNTLSPERVDLTLDAATHTVNLRCGTTSTNIKGIAATEFPQLPEADSINRIALPGALLKSMITETTFAAAKEDNRPILTGILTQFSGSTLTLAAADGYRLAVRTATLEDASFENQIEMVIPARSLAEVARVITDDDSEIAVTLPDERNVMLFSTEHTTISTQLLEGRFPDFNGIIPKSYSTAATVYATDLLRACKRAEIFARDSANSARITVTPPNGKGGPGELRVVGKSGERGDSEGMIDASVEGDALEASFNIRYLIDALNVIRDERVTLESNGPSHPCVIRPEGRDDFVYMVMPMSITR